MPRREPIYRYDQSRRADRAVQDALKSGFLQRPPGMPQPDDTPPAVPTWGSCVSSVPIDTYEGVIRAAVIKSWTRNTEGDMAGYNLRYRRHLASGTGTGTSDLFTDTSATWPADAYIGCTLVDSNGDEFSITDNDATTVTVSGTPASGAYTIRAPYTVIWVDQADSGTCISFKVRNLEMGSTYDFSVEAVDMWGNRSGYCATDQVITPTFEILLNPPRNLTADFSGKDCEVYWDPPEEIGPERDYKIEVRDYEGESILKTYYCDTTRFTLTYDENVRIHGSLPPSPHLHFSVYTRDAAGNLSAAATISATNAIPDAPSSLKTDATGQDFTIEYTISSETDMSHYEFEVVLGE